MVTGNRSCPRWILPGWLVLCFILSACSGDTTPTPTLVAAPTVTPTTPTAPLPTPVSVPTATLAPSPNPTITNPQARYEPGPCPRFPSAPSDCGTLVVPEDRSHPTGRTISLQVLRLKSKNPHPAPDPVVYLQGGPGAYTVDYVPAYYERQLSQLLETRDVIFVDQRGVGLSQPALDCPERSEVLPDLVKQGLAAQVDPLPPSLLQASLACHDRLVKEGVDLAAYTSAESAADLEDLRRAMGYKQWNLFGVSYGTRLALTIMRDFPGGVRSAILDSPVPLQAGLADQPANADHAFEQLFTSCAADSACNRAYPNLKQLFYDTVDKLNTQPAHLNGDAFTLNGDELLLLAEQSLTDPTRIPYLPASIFAAHNGQYSTWTEMGRYLSQGESGLSVGFYFSMRCGDQMPFVTRDQLVAASAAYPQQHQVFSGLDDYAVCEHWGMQRPPDTEHQAVHSDIPTLILTGEFDPGTPRAYGELVARTLSKSYLYTFPAMGHVQTFNSPCAMSFAVSFLDSPTVHPALPCIGEMKEPQWQVSP